MFMNEIHEEYINTRAESRKGEESPLYYQRDATAEKCWSSRNGIPEPGS